MELFKLFGTIALDNSAANQGIDETTGKASGAGTKIMDAFKKIGSAVVTAFAVDKIVEFGKACLEAAADAQAMESQFTQVFGELEGAASESLSAIASNAGIAENRMKGSFTKIAAFAKTTGMDTADALALADRAMIAVADSAAFYDRSLEETTESLQSFLKGNYENDAALGLSCTEITRNAAANELYGKSFQDLSEAQKQLTLLKMVEDANKLSGAMGQAARESDTWTNQTGNLKQAWTDFKATVGGAFLEPAIEAIKKVTEVIQVLTGWLPVVIAWFQSLFSSASTTFPGIQGLFSGMVSALQSIWSAIGQPIFDMIRNCLATVYNAFASQMPAIKEFVQSCFSDIKAFWESNLKPCFEAIGNFIKTVLAPAFEFVFNTVIGPVVKQVFSLIRDLWNGTLKPVLVGITDFLTGVFTGNWRLAFDGIVGIVKGAVNGVITLVENMANAVIGIVNKIIGAINSVIESAGFDFEIGSVSEVSLPRLAKGGVLAKGQVGLLEGDGAEAVVPLDQNRAWITAVAKDMQGAMGGNASQQIGELRAEFKEFVQFLPDVLMDAFASMKFDVNNREFARMVKAVN